MQLGIGAEEHDQEGRVMTAEFDNLFVVNAYVPNAGARACRSCDSGKAPRRGPANESPLRTRLEVMYIDVTRYDST